MLKKAIKATSSVLDRFERKINEQGAGKRFVLFISDEDMDDIIKIVESSEKSGLLIDGATKTVKKEGGFFGIMMTSMAASLIAPMTFWYNLLLLIDKYNI